MGATPLVLKLKRNLEKNFLDEDLYRIYGSGNPYFYCSKCLYSNLDGHDKNCPGLKKHNDKKSLLGQLNRELNQFLTKEQFLSKSFQNYLWQHNDKKGYELNWLLEEIESFKASPLYKKMKISQMINLID